jgi:hypothetical protein
MAYLDTAVKLLWALQKEEMRDGLQTWLKTHRIVN